MEENEKGQKLLKEKKRHNTSGISNYNNSNGDISRSNSKCIFKWRTI